MRVGYRIGATTWRGRLFDAYWSLLRRAMPDAVASHYWLGTDVLDTLREARAGTLGWSRLSGSRDDLHLAAAPWLVDELAEVGLRATTAGIHPVTPAPGEPPPMPSEFGVLSYVPGARFEFYGGPLIMDAARRLPDVRFRHRRAGRVRSVRPSECALAWVGRRHAEAIRRRQRGRADPRTRRDRRHGRRGPPVCPPCRRTRTPCRTRDRIPR